jgi:uncharacterized protein
MKRPLPSEIATEIAGPAGKLEALASECSNPIAQVILCHPHPLFEGTMWNKVITQLTKQFIAQRFNTLRFNYRGVQGSDGQYGKVTGECADAQAVYQWVTAKHSLPMWFCGFSFGSYIAAKLADTHQLPCLMIAPPVMRFPFDPLTFQNPCHIIQGNSDEIVDPQQVIDFAKNKQIPISVVEQASHFFHRQLHVLAEKAQSFIDNNL